MNSKELIKKILRHEEHPRIGFCFSNGYPSDIEFMHGMDLIPSFDPALSVWGRHQELLDAVGEFSGEVKMNPYGKSVSKTRRLSHRDGLRKLAGHQRSSRVANPGS